MTWLHDLLLIWVVCACPVVALVALCIGDAVTLKDKALFLAFGVIATLLSPAVAIWIVSEIVGDLIHLLRRRA